MNKLNRYHKIIFLFSCENQNIHENQLVRIDTNKVVKEYISNFLEISYSRKINETKKI